MRIMNLTLASPGLVVYNLWDDPHRGLRRSNEGVQGNFLSVFWYELVTMYIKQTLLCLNGNKKI